MSQITDFHFSPTQGGVPPQGKKSAVSTLSPNNLGEFDTVCSILVCDGFSHGHVNLVATNLQNAMKLNRFGENHFRKPINLLDILRIVQMGGID
jgi:hypothetical protein